jgi:hypothetical protein
MILTFEPTSLSNNWAPWLSLLLDFAIKGTAIILGAGLLIVVLRRTSAATLPVLSLSIASLLALPVLSLLLPARWPDTPTFAVRRDESSRLKPTQPLVSPPKRRLAPATHLGKVARVTPQKRW